jgi:hypothetical protein
MLGRGYSPFGGKPVCFTELGYLSPDGYPTPLPANFAWGQNTSAAEQASWLAEAATLAAQSGKVRMMIVFNVDYSFYTADDPQGGYAMLRPGGGGPAGRPERGASRGGDVLTTDPVERHVGDRGSRRLAIYASSGCSFSGIQCRAHQLFRPSFVAEPFCQTRVRRNSEVPSCHRRQPPDTDTCRLFVFSEDG